MTGLSRPSEPYDRDAPQGSGGLVPPVAGAEPGQIAKMAADIRARDAELVALRAEITALRRSTSWRVTAPLRAVIRMLRGPR